MKSLLRPWALFVLLGMPTKLLAGAFIPQSTFTLTAASVAAMDVDPAGNLYVLGLLPGATASYLMASYQTPGLQPLLSFNANVSTLAAFAVEAGGVVDILDADDAFTLTRYQNTGETVGQARRIAPYMKRYFAAALDKNNSFLYIAYPSAVIKFTGDFSFTVLYYRGAVDQYDFTGRFLRTFYLPGRSDISTTCYTPSLLSVDEQGSLWVADSVCHHLLSYSPAGLPQADASFPGTPRGLWSGSGSVFVAESVCDSFGCPHGAVLQFDQNGGPQSYFIAGSTVGVAWDPRIVYLGSSNAPSIERFVLNSSPSAPVAGAPAGSVVQHSSTATLSWQASNDADGDSVAYTVFLGTTATQLAPIGGSSQPRFTSPPLAFGATYYWQVRAADSYLGLPLQAAASPVVKFNINLVNSPPGAFAVLGGTGSFVTRDAAVSLAWEAAADPDGDPVTYDVLWRSAPQSSAALAATTTQTAWRAAGLSFGATYYWSVRARDVYDASRLMGGGAEQPVYLAFENSPPGPFSVLSGTGVSTTRSTSTVLSWEPASDPDGDEVSYGLRLSTAAGLLPLVETSTTTGFMLAFQYGTTYYWRVDAYDGFGGTTAASGGAQTFLPLFLNDPPGPLELIAPFNGSPLIRTMRGSVSVSWARVANPQGDPLTYTVYLGDSPASLDVLTRIGPAGAAPVLIRPRSEVELDGDTIRLTLSALDFYKTYYLRIVASNPYGASSTTPVQTFSLGAANGFPKAYNYPNPFNPNRGGTHLVFNAPPSGYARATVSVYSELQDLLFERVYENIPPGVSEAAFDGRDKNGRILFNGSYICRVRFAGPDDKETFYLMVVK